MTNDKMRRHENYQRLTFNSKLCQFTEKSVAKRILFNITHCKDWLKARGHALTEALWDDHDYVCRSFGAKSTN